MCNTFPFRPFPQTRPCCQVLELDPDSAWAKAAVKRLEPLVAARHEKLKDEMLGKLKELGNSILGK